MARHRKEQPALEITATDRLGLRVSAMIGSPKAQLERRAVIHRLDSDSDEAWTAIMELLGETAGLSLTFDCYGNAVVNWEAEEEAVEREADDNDGEALEETAPF